MRLTPMVNSKIQQPQQQQQQQNHLLLPIENHQKDRKLTELIVHNRKREVATFRCHMIRISNTRKKQCKLCNHSGEPDDEDDDDVAIPMPSNQHNHNRDHNPNKYDHHHADDDHVRTSASRPLEDLDELKLTKRSLSSKIIATTTTTSVDRTMIFQAARENQPKQEVEGQAKHTLAAPLNFLKKLTSTTMGPLYFSNIFILLLISLLFAASINLQVINCEQSVIRPRLMDAIAQQLLNDNGGAWIEMKRHHHNHNMIHPNPNAAGGSASDDDLATATTWTLAKNVGTNNNNNDMRRRMDEDEDGDPDDDEEEDNEMANETASSSLSSSSSSSARRTKRNHGDKFQANNSTTTTTTTTTAAIDTGAGKEDRDANRSLAAGHRKPLGGGGFLGVAAGAQFVNSSTLQDDVTANGSLQRGKVDSNSSSGAKSSGQILANSPVSTSGKKEETKDRRKLVGFWRQPTSAASRQSSAIANSNQEKPMEASDEKGKREASRVDQASRPATSESRADLSNGAQVGLQPQQKLDLNQLEHDGGGGDDGEGAKKSTYLEAAEVASGEKVDPEASSSHGGASRNLNASLEAGAQLKAILAQLHLNKSTLDKSSSSIRDENNLLPSESKPTNVYANLVPLANNNNNNNNINGQQNARHLTAPTPASSPTISVSPTRAPTNSIEYTNNIKNQIWRSSAGGSKATSVATDLVAAASGDETGSHQQRRFPATTSAAGSSQRRPSKMGVHNSLQIGSDTADNGDQWGRRKSTANSQVPADVSILETAKQQSSLANVTSTHDDNMITSTWAPAIASLAAAAAAYRSSAQKSQTPTGNDDEGQLAAFHDNSSNLPSFRDQQQESPSPNAGNVSQYYPLEPSSESDSTDHQISNSHPESSSQVSSDFSAETRNWRQQQQVHAPSKAMQTNWWPPETVVAAAAGSKVSQGHEMIVNSKSNNHHPAASAPQPVKVPPTNGLAGDDPTPGAGGGGESYGSDNESDDESNSGDQPTDDDDQQLANQTDTPQINQTQIVGPSSQSIAGRQPAKPIVPSLKQSDWPRNFNEPIPMDKLTIPSTARPQPLPAPEVPSPVTDVNQWNPAGNLAARAVSSLNSHSFGNGEKFRSNRHLSGFGTKSANSNMIPAPVAKSDTSSPAAVSRGSPSQFLQSTTFMQQQQQPIASPQQTVFNNGNSNQINSPTQQQIRTFQPSPAVAAGQRFQTPQPAVHPVPASGWQQQQAAQSMANRQRQVPSKQRAQLGSATIQQQQQQQQQFPAPPPPMVQRGFVQSSHRFPTTPQQQQQQQHQRPVPAPQPDRMDESLRPNGGEALRAPASAIDHHQQQNSAAASAIVQQRQRPNDTTTSTLSITTFPYPAPATDALSFFSVYPSRQQQHHYHGFPLLHNYNPQYFHGLHPHRHQKFSKPHQQSTEHHDQFQVATSNGPPIKEPPPPSSKRVPEDMPEVDPGERKVAPADSQKAAMKPSSDHMIVANQRAEEQQPERQASPKQSEQQQQPPEQQQKDDYLTINLQTHASVGPNQLFWEAAAREVAKSQSDSNFFEPSKQVASTIVSNAHGGGGGILRRPMRYASRDDYSPQESGHTNGHAKQPPALGLRSLSTDPYGDDVTSFGGGHFSPFMDTLGGFYPIGAFATRPAAAAMEPNYIAASAVPVAAFMSPDDEQTKLAIGQTMAHHHHAFQQHQQAAAAAANSNQFVKKGQSIISAALPLATPATVRDPFGWPMGYGSEATKSLIKVNHVAPPPAYLIPAKVTAAQSSALLYPTMVDLKHPGSAAPIKEDPNTFISGAGGGGDHHLQAASEQHGSVDPVDEMADQWSSQIMMMGQHSIVRPQIWVPAVGDGHLLRQQRKQQQQQIVPAASNLRVNQVRVAISTRPPVAAVKRPSFWRRLFLRNNRSLSDNNNRKSKVKENNNKNSFDQQPESDAEALAKVFKTEPNNTSSKLLRSSDGNGYENLVNYRKLWHRHRGKRSLRDSVSNFVSSIKSAAQAVVTGAAGKGAQYGNSNNGDYELLQNQASKSASHQVALEPSGSHLGSQSKQLYKPASSSSSTRTSFIPLVDNPEQHLMANIESDLLTQALLLGDQQSSFQPSSQRGSIYQSTMPLSSSVAATSIADDNGAQSQANRSQQQQQQDPMMDTSSMLVASHTSLSQQLPPSPTPQTVFSQLHQGEFRPLMMNEAAGSQLDPHLYSPMEPDATLEPPANLPGVLNKPQNSSRVRLAQLSKSFLESSKKPLNKLMRITSLGGPKRATNSSTSSSSSSGGGAGKHQAGDSAVSGSQKSISVAHQLGAIVSPAVMMSDGVGGGSLENFNRFALPLQQWFRQQQQQQQQNVKYQHQPSSSEPARMIIPLSYIQHQLLLPLVSHKTHQLSPYSFITSGSLPLEQHRPPKLVASRLRADIPYKASNFTSTATSNKSQFLSVLPYDGAQLLFHGAAKNLLDLAKTLKSKRSNGPQKSLSMVNQLKATITPATSTSLQLYGKSYAPKLAKGLTRGLERVQLMRGGVRQKLRPSPRSGSANTPTLLYQPTILHLRQSPTTIGHPVSMRRISDLDQRLSSAAAAAASGQSVQVPFVTTHYPPSIDATNATNTHQIGSGWPGRHLNQISGHDTDKHHHHHRRHLNFPPMPAPKTSSVPFKNVFMGPARSVQHRGELHHAGLGNRFNFRFGPKTGGSAAANQNSNTNSNEMAINLMAMRNQFNGPKNHSLASGSQSELLHSRFNQVEPSEIYPSSSNQHQIEMSAAEVESAKMAAAASGAEVGAGQAQHHHHHPQQTTSIEPTAIDESSFNSLVAAATAAASSSSQEDLQSLLPTGSVGGGSPGRFQPPEVLGLPGVGGKEIGPASSVDVGGSGSGGGGGDFTSEQQQQYQQQLLNQQQQQMMYHPDLGNGIAMARPTARLPLPKIIPSINSMASKFRQHLFQTFKLNPARWPMLSSASTFMSYPKFQMASPNFMASQSHQHNQLQIPLPQQHQLRLQVAHQQQQNRQPKQQLISRPPNPLSQEANFYNFAAAGNAQASIESPSKQNGQLHFATEQQQQQVASGLHQFQVPGPATAQYQQQQLLSSNNNHNRQQQLKLNVGVRPHQSSLTASEQAAIQMEGQLANMVANQAGDGNQAMVEDGSQIMYTDKVPGAPEQQQQQQQQQQQVAEQHQLQQQHHQHHHQHPRMPIMGDQAMVEFVAASSGANGSSPAPLAEELQAANGGGVELYEQEILVDPNSMINQGEESVASQLANGQELLIQANQNIGEQQLLGHPVEQQQQPSPQPPQHSVMTDVSSNLVTSDGTYIQEEPTTGGGGGGSPSGPAGQHQVRLQQQQQRQNMGELATATQQSDSKEMQEQSGSMNTTAVLHHHHHMMVPVSEEPQPTQSDRKRLEQQQQQQQQQQQLASIESHAPQEAPGGEQQQSLNEYEIAQQAPRVHGPPRTKKVMVNGGKQRTRFRIIDGGDQPMGQRESKQQMLAMASNGENHADYQIIKANNQLDSQGFLQYTNGSGVLVNPTHIIQSYQKNGQKLIASNTMHQQQKLGTPDASEEEQQQQQQQQQPIIQQVYEFENQLGPGEHYYEPARTSNQSSISDSETVSMQSAMYAENGTESQQHVPMGAVLQQRPYKPQRHQHIQRPQQQQHQHTLTRLAAQAARAQPVGTRNHHHQQQQQGNQSEATVGGVEYLFRPLPNNQQLEEPQTKLTSNSGEQVADESGLSQSQNAFQQLSYGVPITAIATNSTTRSLYPFVSQRATQIIRLSNNSTPSNHHRHRNHGGKHHDHGATVGSLSSSSQDQYVLVDRPPGGGEPAANQTNMVTEVIRQHGNGSLNSISEQPMVYVSLKPDKIILPIQNSADQQQQQQQHQQQQLHELHQLQQVQLQLQLQNKRRPVKGPKGGGQAKIQWQQQQPLANRLPVQRPAAPSASKTKSQSQQQETAAPAPSQTVQTNATIMMLLPNELIENGGGGGGAAAADLNVGGRNNFKLDQLNLKNIKNHNLKATTPAPSLVMRGDGTRPPKAKIRWQGMSGAANRTAVGANGLVANVTSGLNAPSRAIEQAWLVNGMTHQAYASNHKHSLVTDHQQQQDPINAHNGSQQWPMAAQEQNEASPPPLRLYQNHKHSSYPDLSGSSTSSRTNSSSSLLQEESSTTNSTVSMTTTTSTTTIQPETQDAMDAAQTITTTAPPSTQTHGLMGGGSEIMTTTTTTQAPYAEAGETTTTTGNPLQPLGSDLGSSRVYSHFGIQSSGGRSRQESGGKTINGGGGDDGGQRGRFQTFRSSSSRSNNHKQSSSSSSSLTSGVGTPQAPPTATSPTSGSGTQRRDSRTGSTSFRLSSTSSSTSQAPQLPLPGSNNAPPTQPMNTPEMAGSQPDISTTNVVTSSPSPATTVQPSERPTVFVSSVELGPSRQTVDHAAANLPPTAASQTTLAPNILGHTSGTEYPVLGNFSQPDKPNARQQAALVESPSHGQEMAVEKAAAGISVAEVVGAFFQGRGQLTGGRDDHVMLESEHSDRLLGIHNERMRLHDGAGGGKVAPEMGNSPMEFVVSAGGGGLLVPDSSIRYNGRNENLDGGYKQDESMISLATASKHSSD